MLATLKAGDRIPYKLDNLGLPTYLTVTAVLDPGTYEVEYPDGHRGVLTDADL